jgi:hypothetical protein
MDRINQAMQGTNDPEQMMRDVLDAMLSIFDSDRAFLLYPCDPDAPSFEAAMERTRPEYPGGKGVIPTTPDAAKHFQLYLASSGAVTLGPGCDYPLIGEFAETSCPLPSWRKSHFRSVPTNLATEALIHQPYLLR